MRKIYRPTIEENAARRENLIHLQIGLMLPRNPGASFFDLRLEAEKIVDADHPNRRPLRPRDGILIREDECGQTSLQLRDDEIWLIQSDKNGDEQAVVIEDADFALDLAQALHIAAEEMQRGQQ